MTTRYSNRFENFFNFTRILSVVCGADVIKADYKMNWITWGIVVLANSAFSFIFYSIYVSVSIKHEYSEILNYLCMSGVVVQAYTKLLNGITNRDMFRYLYEEIIGVYVTYEQKSSNYHEHLNGSIKLFKKLIAILSLISVTATLSIIGVPFFYQIVFNKRIFVMPFFLPYVDYETDSGYYLTSTFHIILITFSILGNFISDIWCFVYAVHIPLLKNVLQVKFNELDEMILQEKKENEIKQQLTDIFNWHQKYIVYCNTVKNSFFWITFIQIAMEFISIVCTIVCIFLGVWPAAPVYLIYSVLLLYFHCTLGNIVEISNDNVTTMIYDSCWYKLTVPQQKMIRIMLRQSQQAEGMSIGGIAPLTLNTALQLTKTIYTFSMMLRNYLN